MRCPSVGNRSYFGNLAGSLFIVFLLDETLLFHGAAAPAGLASAMAVSVAKVAVLHTPHTCPKKAVYSSGSVYPCRSLRIPGKGRRVASMQSRLPGILCFTRIECMPPAPASMDGRQVHACTTFSPTLVTDTRYRHLPRLHAWAHISRDPSDA